MSARYELKPRRGQGSVPRLPSLIEMPIAIACARAGDQSPAEGARSPTAARSRSASSARARTPASAASPCTPTRTGTRCSSGSPTRRTRSAAPRRPTPTSTSTRSSRSPTKSGADSVHPGYGFLAENAEFAQAVIDAGLIWIGPPPAAIDALGDKVQARHIAQKVGAPLVAGTKDPVNGRRRGRRVRRRARPADRDQGRVRRRRPRPQGRPQARGGRRALRVGRPRGGRARSAAASASWSATSTGRATSRPSASPTSTATSSWSPPATARCSAATRSSSRRRPRRSSPTTRSRRSTESSKAILREAGYVGAGTCEFLVGQDGTISFLEVNTRLQVEHPVSEEVTGIDLVREMFRIAAGEELGYDDPEVARPLDRVPDQRRGRRPRTSCRRPAP